MGELIFYFIIPALSFVCATLSYLIVKWKQLDRKYMYVFISFISYHFCFLRDSGVLHVCFLSLLMFLFYLLIL